MHLRRKLALATVVLALAPVLSSCGFGVATERVYTPAAGPINRDGEVDVLSAVIVSGSPGEGTFVAGLSNKSGDQSISLTSFAPVDSGAFTASSFEPRSIPPLGYANLSDPDQGIGVIGDFVAGDFIPVELTFDNGQTTRMDIPVVRECDMWAGHDTAKKPGNATRQDADASEADADAGDLYECDALPPVTDFGGETSDETHSEGDQE
ncbi:hypothetical protein [Nocardioides acrostichi]|uniref:Lipoprotein n=1 Tax=Nocardioides acrostichi TaxID=2784339 RepID=A0A930Y5Q0_9ACTN|nr:hypothetical protein [Nocardioides acrostichi]MBF4161480.1 hypothetical protein [Nocardioides acrostichi]